MEKQQQVVVVGVGFFEERLLRTITPEWPGLIIDISHERIDQLKQDIPELHFVHGDATSRLTWTALHEDTIRIIIVALRNEVVSLETCRMIRESFSATVPVLVLHDGPWDSAAFQQLGAELIQPVDIALQVIRNRLQRNYSRAINIGLGLGELLEINILAASHLVDRKLKYLRPSRWAVSAIYRKGELIVPTGNSRMRVGDRVVLVGDPKVLENVAGILNRGVPQFPLQYGTDVLVPLHSDHGNLLGEASHWLAHSRATRFHLVPFRRRLTGQLIDQVRSQDHQFHVGDGVELFSELLDTVDEDGLLIMPSGGFGFRSRLAKAFQGARIPFVVSRESHPYEKVLVNLNNGEPAHVLETATEISRLMKVPLAAFYVALPKELRGREGEEALKLRQHVVDDFAGILDMNIPYQVLEGNPVKAGLVFLRSQHNALLVTMANREFRTGLFNRNTAFRLAQRSHLSTLVIPEVDVDA